MHKPALQPQLCLADSLACMWVQVFECLRATVKPDTVMVLPALPFPPPKRNAKEVGAHTCEGVQMEGRPCRAFECVIYLLAMCASQPGTHRMDFGRIPGGAPPKHPALLLLPIAQTISCILMWAQMT
eukprot:1153084-Pelagomonas_calceolata.AAC.7